VSEGRLQQLLYHLGFRTDAASSIGSLHAKVADVKNTITSTTYGTPFHTKTVTVTYTGVALPVASAAAANVISITGPRLVLGGAFVCYDSSGNRLFTFKVIRDGVTVWEGTPGDSTYLSKGGIPFRTYDATNYYQAFYCDIRGPFLFNSSLVLQVYNNSVYTQTAAVGGMVWHVSP